MWSRGIRATGNVLLAEGNERTNQFKRVKSQSQSCNPAVLSDSIRKQRNYWNYFFNVLTKPHILWVVNEVDQIRKGHSWTISGVKWCVGQKDMTRRHQQLQPCPVEPRIPCGANEVVHTRQGVSMRHRNSNVAQSSVAISLTHISAHTSHTLIFYWLSFLLDFLQIVSSLQMFVPQYNLENKSGMHQDLSVLLYFTVLLWWQVVDGIGTNVRCLVCVPSKNRCCCCCCWRDSEGCRFLWVVKNVELLSQHDERHTHDSKET